MIPAEIRLNRFIAQCGICSRREADERIQNGFIEVNGKKVTQLGTKISPTDRVTYKGKIIKPERFVYVLLNKPKDYIVTLSDEKDRRTVMDLVKDATSERIFPVGRLDRNTTGVLLLTNDGELAQKLTHPSQKIQKVYYVILNKNLSLEDMSKIAEGVELDDGMAHADEIAYTDERNKNEIGIEIHEGRNRIIRRIFEKLGYEVKNLDRVLFANLTKKNLPRGKWRFLTKQEVIALKYRN